MGLFVLEHLHIVRDAVLSEMPATGPVGSGPPGACRPKCRRLGGRELRVVDEKPPRPPLPDEGSRRQRSRLRRRRIRHSKSRQLDPMIWRRSKRKSQR